MNRAHILFCFTAFLFFHPLIAEEGMWPPEQLPEIKESLKRLGLEVDPEQLSDLTGQPMNAVISLGGCTASFVSPGGLVITNHHCAYGSLQFNSSAEKNLLENGFLARSQEEELPAVPGSRVYVTVEFKDVTERVLEGIPDGVSGKERYDRIESNRKGLVTACEQQETGFRCRVATYHGGLKYSLVRQLELRDVRLVYAPPSGVGRFGGEIDNWMWPRHTGDFALYRAYIGRNGKPADFAANNVPFQPKHYLKVAPQGVQEGDFVMVAGYPYSTGRYRLSSEVEDTFSWGYPRRIEFYQNRLDTIQREIQDRPDAKIKYASHVAGLNNALKNHRGMLDGYAESNMLMRKRELEKALSDWIAADQKRVAGYGTVLERLQEVLAEARKTRERDFILAWLNRSALLSGARTLYRLAKEKEKPDTKRKAGYQERDWDRIRQRIQRFDRRFDPQVDRATMLYSLLEYHKLPFDIRIPELDNWFRLQAGDAGAGESKTILSQMYAETSIAGSEAQLKLLEATPAELEASPDPFLRLAIRLYPVDLQLEAEQEERIGMLQELRPKYMEALIAFLKSRGKQIYPDANGTLRITYGTVKGYSPKDAIVYKPFTTIEGVLEKDTGEEPFDTPEKAFELMRRKQYGRYVSSLGAVPVNFLSTCDTTGGNSGSATMNGRGELVGLLFDGTYESMIADWDFLPDLTRSIHVDIRYVLWYMEEVDRASNLLSEMGIK